MRPGTSNAGEADASAYGSMTVAVCGMGQAFQSGLTLSSHRLSATRSSLRAGNFRIAEERSSVGNQHFPDLVSAPNYGGQSACTFTRMTGQSTRGPTPTPGRGKRTGGAPEQGEGRARVSAHAARPELHADPRTHGTGRLGHRVLPRALARTTHDDQIPVAGGKPIAGGATAAGPQRKCSGGPQ